MFLLCSVSASISYTAPEGGIRGEGRKAGGPGRQGGKKAGTGSNDPATAPQSDSAFLLRQKRDRSECLNGVGRVKTDVWGLRFCGLRLVPVLFPFPEKEGHFHAQKVTHISPSLILQSPHVPPITYCHHFSHPKLSPFLLHPRSFFVVGQPSSSIS